MAINVDGSYGSRATQKELAELYGKDAAYMISYTHEVVESMFSWHRDNIYQQATIAANHGRRALKQSKLR